MKKLSEIKNLNKLNTSNVTNMNGMFYHCRGLTELTLPESFDTSNVTDMLFMFEGCSVLETIYAAPGTDWYHDGIDMRYMFSGCTNLMGGNGTLCDGEVNIGGEYARIDGLDGNPGYFTAYIADVCKGSKAVSLGEGTYELRLGGVSYGDFTFTRCGIGWTIMDADGQYAAIEDGSLVMQEEPFVWKYGYGCFYAGVTPPAGSWWYAAPLRYLAGDGGALTVSRSNRNACAVFYESFAYDEHSYGKCVSCKDGTHSMVCKRCGDVVTGDCSYGDDHCCTECGFYDPAAAEVKVTVTVKETRTGWWWNARTTWTATIKAEGIGVQIRTVEYSADGSRWTKGSFFTGYQEISSFYIRVTDSQGAVHTYQYLDGEVTETEI